VQEGGFKRSFLQKFKKKDGLAPYCKFCDQARAKKYREAIKAGTYISRRKPPVTREVNGMALVPRREVKELPGKVKGYIRVACCGGNCATIITLKYIGSNGEVDSYIGECDFCRRVIEMNFNGA
jgi:hypothetical protein